MHYAANDFFSRVLYHGCSMSSSIMPCARNAVCEGLPALHKGSQSISAHAAHSHQQPNGRAGLIPRHPMNPPLLHPRIPPTNLVGNCKRCKPCTQRKPPGTCSASDPCLYANKLPEITRPQLLLN